MQDVRPVLSALVRQVSSDLALASVVKHPGESGRAREQIISAFITGVVPESFGVGSGFIFDAIGSVSRQIDVVIFRRGYHPIFRIGAVPLFMVESVVAAIEVKARIKSKAVLSDALANLASVRALDRTNRGQNYTVEGSHVGDPVADSYAHRVFTAVVTESSLSKDKLTSEVLAFLRTNPRRLWPNAYVDVHKWLVAYAQQAQPGGHVETDCDFDRSRFLTFTDNNDPKFVSPLFEMTLSLLDYLRIAPIVDYKPNSYLAIAGGRVTWTRIDDPEMPPSPGVTQSTV